ncbi:hypothetical protein FACS1894120_0120 [Clostridia bacterium]|nr:hypothetical protein FACS1894120_0120 [Clostridia bacterium]
MTIQSTIKLNQTAFSFKLNGNKNQEKPQRREREPEKTEKTEKAEKRTDRQEANYAFAEHLKETAETSEGDKQLQKILEKFNGGQKLTPSELSYLSTKDPQTYQHVADVTRRREALEQQMKEAKTKDGVNQAYAAAIQSVLTDRGAGGAPDEVLIKHLNNAYHEYSGTKKYAAKPNESQLAEEEKKLAKAQRAEAKQIKSEEDEKAVEEAEKVRKRRRARGESGESEESEAESLLMQSAAQFKLDIQV